MKRQHRIVIDVTFDRPITETDAAWIMRAGIDVSGMVGRIKKEIVVPTPGIYKVEVKRWSKVLPYVLNEFKIK